MIRVGVEGFPVSGRRTGVGRVVGELVVALHRLSPDVEVTVVLHRGHPEGPPEIGDLEAAGVDLVEMGRPMAMVHGLAGRLGIPFPFNVVAPGRDVWFFPSHRPYPTMGTPTISMVHDLGYLAVPDCVHPDGIDALRRYIPRLVATSDRIVVVSETMREELVTTFPEARNRAVVVPNAPASAMVGPPPDDWRSRLERLGLPRSGYLLHVGTVEPRKNLLPLIAALERLPATTTDEHPLVLVGPDGWSNAEEKRAIEGAGRRVKWLDFVSDEDLRALYEGAALFVFPTRYEGFGIPVLEAMVTGTPVACSDIPVMHEVTGGAAAFFDNSDPRDIAGELNALLSDRGRREELVEDGYVQAGRYSWDRSATVLAAIIRQVASS